MKVSRASVGLIAAAIAVGSLGLGSPAQADPKKAIPSVPCAAGGVTRADTAVATKIRPLMTGRRLGRSVSGYSISCARAIVDHVLGRKLPARAAVIAVTTAITESSLRNYSLAVDHDSLGLFQQRPSMGWGRPSQLLDPAYATRKFLDKMLRTHPGNRWMSGEIGRISQRVQASSFPTAYEPEVGDAALIVAQLLNSPRTPATTTTAPRTPSGPYSKTLLQAAPGLPEAFDDRHQLMLADWNGDRHQDLVVLQRSGTLTGRVEVQVVNGARQFRDPLLRTTVPMDATDDRHAFAMADWNADGRADLVIIQRSGTASGKTEVRVLDGASFLQRWLPAVVTSLGPTDACHVFSVADWNADKRPDLTVIQQCGTPSARTEVRVLDGASGLQQFLRQDVTPMAATDARHSFTPMDWNGDGQLDLVLTQKSGAAGNKTVVRVLDGAKGFRNDVVPAITARVTTDDRHAIAVTDWNADKKQDLVVIQKAGTATGRSDLHIFAG